MLLLRNLLPGYHRAMLDEIIGDLDDIEKYGMAWERQLSLDVRYTLPVPVDKMLVRGAAFIGGSVKSHIAA